MCSPWLAAGLPALLERAPPCLLTLAWFPTPWAVVLLQPPQILSPPLPACSPARLQTDQALADSRWKEERDAKKEADWDARLKEAYKCAGR